MKYINHIALEAFKKITSKTMLKKIFYGMLGLVLLIFTIHATILGFSEIQTFYYIILMEFSWILTSGIMILWYNNWCVTKKNIEGEDNKLNQAERISLQKVHAFIILGASLILIASSLIYYGKKSDEIFIDNNPITNTYTTTNTK